VKQKRKGSIRHLPVRGHSAGAGWVALLLHIPLFWKLLLAALAVTAGTAAAVLWVASSGAGEAGFGTLIAVLAGVTVGTALIQTFVLSVALSPLTELERVAEQVRDGRMQVRAQRSAVSDSRLERLRLTINEMLDELEASGQRQRSAGRNAFGEEESERDQISRALFRGPAQTLAGLLLHLRVLARRHPGTADEIAGFEAEVRLALEELRTLARQLRPPELDELGLHAAVEAQARSVREIEGRDVRVLGSAPDRLDPAASLTLFRFAQRVMRGSTGTIELLFEDRHGRLVLDVIWEHDDETSLPVDPHDWIERIAWAGGSLAHEPLPDGAQRVRILMPFTTSSSPLSQELTR